jgi:RimJ/RimL family protein N-acetyltransferase
MVVNLGRTKRERAQLSPKMGKVHTHVWSENFKARGLLKRLSVDKKKILKFIFEEQSVTMWTGQT